MDASISAQDLRRALRSRTPPLVIEQTQERRTIHIYECI